MSAANSSWGVHVVLQVHMHAISSFVFDVDGQRLAVVIRLGWDCHGQTGSGGGSGNRESSVDDALRSSQLCVL